ncbi:cytochrome c [Vibrio sp. TH_r3]|uniref:c-type cytochrome n=1 Tax=Vibrio sp. TH_r3 TaxID=3082084 RepID=UPI002954330E|nr:cytochrome c [Vibrio sp. TH_r3]MDV7105050.1 cytochrome c [Vibrio sp. TH_r3]
MSKFVAGLVVVTALLSSSAFAGDPEAGKAKSMICAACHGMDGKSVIDGYPNLAGQNEKYIISSIKAYRSKQRTGGNAAIMQPQAAILNDQDIENLAAYYSQMK